MGIISQRIQQSKQNKRASQALVINQSSSHSHLSLTSQLLLPRRVVSSRSRRPPHEALKKKAETKIKMNTISINPLVEKKHQPRLKPSQKIPQTKKNQRKHTHTPTPKNRSRNSRVDEPNRGTRSRLKTPAPRTSRTRPNQSSPEGNAVM